MTAQKRRSVLLVIIDIGLALIFFIITMQSADTIIPPEPSASSNIPIATFPWSPKVFYQVQPGDSLESIAKKVGMTSTELSRMNGISSTLDLYAGQELSISVPKINELYADIPNAFMTPTMEPIATDASPSEIRGLMLKSGQFWRTLWMDTQEASSTLEYPETNDTAYIRRQVWIQQPNLSYEITNYLWVSNQMDFYRAIILNGQGYYAFGSNSYFYWDTDWRLPAGDILYNPFLDDMVFPGKSDLVVPDRQYSVIGQSEVSGRKALIADTWRDGDKFQRRIWVDVQTGVILRYQIKFPDLNGKKDFIVTKIAFNVPIPPALFDPRQPRSGGFAIDYSGWAPTPDSSRATDTPAISGTPPVATP
jgi:LysM repeat protein